MRLFLFFIIPLFSFGEVCPQKIKYFDGGYLKNGDKFFYPDGRSLIGSESIYYPNGLFLKKSGKVYYPNGQLIQFADRLFYPNGETLKNRENYYYDNSQILKFNDNFYYKNGNIARRAGKLYRPNGTETVFPITIKENIQNYGALHATVEAKNELVDISFNGKFIDHTQVQGYLNWNGRYFDYFWMIINTGLSSENIFVSIKDSHISCELITDNFYHPHYSNIYNPFYSISSPVAKVWFKINPGHNPFVVREKIKKALKELE